MEMRLRAPVTRGYFFLLGALRLVNAASPRNIDQKKISSGTQGSQDDESSSEDDPDWGSLEDSAVTEDIDSDDDESSRGIDDKDDSRNTLRCVQYFTVYSSFY